MQALKTVIRNVALLALIPAGAVVYSSLNHVPEPTQQTFINKESLEAKAWLVQQIKPVLQISSQVVQPDVGTADLIKTNSALICEKTGKYKANLLERLNATNLTLAALSQAKDASGQSTKGNYLLIDVYAFDVSAILLQTQAKPSADKKRLSDVCEHLKNFNANNGASFAELQWREHRPSEAKRKQFESTKTYAMFDYGRGKSNPWAALNGCTYVRTKNNQLGYFDAKLGRDGEVTAEGVRLSHLCTSDRADHPSAKAVELPNENSPSNWQQIAPALRAAAAAQFNQVNNWFSQSNNVEVLNRRVPQGAHVVATLENQTQSTSQAVANCLTGNAKDCAALGIDAGTWSSFYEQSASRMMGIAVIDLPTGDIQAIASAHTKCYEQQYDGPGRDADCPNIPAIPAKKNHMLDNHALYTQVMPGSLVKPVTALAMMQDPIYAKRLMGAEAPRFREELKTSDSKSFHDRLFCAEKGFKDCDRLAYLPSAAELLGWNFGCLSHPNKTSSSGMQTVKASLFSDCTKFSAATGRDIASQREADLSKSKEVKQISQTNTNITPVPALTVPGGTLGIRVIKQGQSQDSTYAPHIASFTPEWAQECASASRGKERWSKCKGGTGSAIEMLSEAWGQGDARATPLSIAMMLAHLGAAANGKSEVKLPHLLSGAINPNLQTFEAVSRKHGISKAHAELIVSGMQGGHTLGGTSNSACKAVLGAACNTKEGMAWVAGKTGTPVFNYDTATINNRANICAAYRSERESLFAQLKQATAPEPEVNDSTLDDDTEDLPDTTNIQKRIAKLNAKMFHCNASPYKWYATLIKSGGNQQKDWDKAIVVLAERNWNKSNELVDAPADRGVNVAARAAFEIIKRVYYNAPK
jgi:hypothetical protein